MSNSALIGKIVSWPNIEDKEDDAYLGAGRGEILAILDGPYMLVRRVPRHDDPEPPHSLIVWICRTGLRYFDTLAQEESWYEWICADAEPDSETAADS